MQYEPRQSSAPPSPIEPTGFFTGIQIRPIIIGVVIDTISTMLLTTLYYVGYVAKDLAGQGAPAEDAFSIYWSSSEGLVASLLLGSLGTLIGGCYAAYKAGKLHMKHGALVGIGSIILGLLLQSGNAESNVPEWFMALSFAAAVPAGALGGFFAEMLRNFTGGGDRSSVPGQPRL
jgi:putative membrane protein (TIGR04086 family)